MKMKMKMIGIKLGHVEVFDVYYLFNIRVTSVIICIVQVHGIIPRQKHSFKNCQGQGIENVISLLTPGIFSDIDCREPNGLERRDG